MSQDTPAFAVSLSANAKQAIDQALGDARQRGRRATSDDLLVVLTGQVGTTTVLALQALGLEPRLLRDQIEQTGQRGVATEDLFQVLKRAGSDAAMVETRHLTEAIWTSGRGVGSRLLQELPCSVDDFRRESTRLASIAPPGRISSQIVLTARALRALLEQAHLSESAEWTRLRRSLILELAQLEQQIRLEDGSRPTRSSPSES